MNGTSATTGKSLSGIDHLNQSIRDILTTPIGSRIFRRDYGSLLFSLIDAPMNSGTIAAIRAASASAITKWEPRFSVKKVDIVSAAPGNISLKLSGVYLEGGKTITIDGIIIK